VSARRQRAKQDSGERGFSGQATVHDVGLPPGGWMRPYWTGCSRSPDSPRSRYGSKKLSSVST
jgi:hypothetical protein